MICFEGFSSSCIGEHSPTASILSSISLVCSKLVEKLNLSSISNMHLLQRPFDVHFYFARRSFSLFISSLRIDIDPELSSFITALFFINFAHCANFKVDKVSP